MLRSLLAPLTAFALAAPGRLSAATPTDTIPGTNWTVEDWRIFEAKVRWAVAHRLNALPPGSAIVRLGASFVGTAYIPATLEVPGPERLVVNLRALDCVTFVENMIAMTRFIRRDGVRLLADPAAARAKYEEYLRDLRYRGGTLDGYASRLHYFSEWLADNESRGAIRQLSHKLGGTLDHEPIDFMSTHAGAYRQLGEPGVRDAIAEVEHRLNAGPGRWYIPKDRIASIAGKIRDGDIIAATSTVAGLDVAHTGFALWQHGKLHLLHAPLVGKSVEISRLPLAKRIQGIRTQDGIMVGRLTLPASARPRAGLTTGTASNDGPCSGQPRRRSRRSSCRRC